MSLESIFKNIDNHIKENGYNKKVARIFIDHKFGKIITDRNNVYWGDGKELDYKNQSLTRECLRDAFEMVIKK